MIYDSEQQKQFILEAVKKYPTSYENALQLANAFGMAIQSGQVIDPKEQNKAFPPSTAGAAPQGDPKANGNRKARRAANKDEARCTPPN
jgi:hypothetical protein